MPPRLRPFAVRLGLVGLVAAAVRVTSVAVWLRHYELGLTDNFFYHGQALALADGLGYVNPFLLETTGELVPTAGWPPGYASFLALVTMLGGESVLAHRLASALLGAVGVVLVGLVGRRIASERAGLVAAALAAVYPILWVNDGLLVSETLFAPMTALVILVAYRTVATPTWQWAAGLGLACGAAALTRAEGLMWLGLLVVPLFAWSLRALPWRRRLALGALAVGVGLAVIAPWVTYNLNRFEKPVLLSSGSGFVLAVGNCDATYGGDFLGYWNMGCALTDWPEGDESVAEAAARAQGLGYARDHLGRVPVVVAARILRMFDLFRPWQNVEYNDFFERRGAWTSAAGLAMYYAMLPVAAYGVVALWRRKVTLVPLVAPVLSVTATAAMAFGITRYRVPADVVLVVLAGVGADAALDAWRRRRGASVAGDGPAGPAGPDGGDGAGPDPDQPPGSPTGVAVVPGTGTAGPDATGDGASDGDAGRQDGGNPDRADPDVPEAVPARSGAPVAEQAGGAG